MSSARSSSEIVKLCVTASVVVAMVGVSVYGYRRNIFSWSREVTVPSHELDGAGLGTFLTKLLDEADLGADAQVVESARQDAVPMEEYLAAVGRL